MDVGSGSRRRGYRRNHVVVDGSEREPLRGAFRSPVAIVIATAARFANSATGAVRASEGIRAEDRIGTSGEGRARGGADFGSAGGGACTHRTAPADGRQGEAQRGEKSSESRKQRGCCRQRP